MAISSEVERRSAMNVMLQGGSYIMELPVNSDIERYNLAGYYGHLSIEEEVEEILECCTEVKGVVRLIFSKVTKLEKSCDKLAEFDDHWKFLYSAIRDIRREILRGKNQRR